MIPRPQITATEPQVHSFPKLMERLRESFPVRDVMVPLSKIERVAPGECEAAERLVVEKKYSVVPVSDDDHSFESATADREWREKGVIS